MTSRTNGGYFMAIIVALAAIFVLPAPAWADHEPIYGQHWSNAAPQLTSKAQVYIEDYTGANWPVINAVSKWDNQSYILVYYKSAGTCNHGLVHCVHAVEYYSSTDGRYGHTNLIIDSSRHLKHGTHSNPESGVVIHFNNYYVPRTTTAQRRKVTCHEVGHSLGLMESHRDDSCMDQDLGTWYEYTSKHDFDVLWSMYAVHSDW